MDRYIPNGTPLTDRERELLTVLIEECCEVVCAATKLMRFGKENRPTPGGEPNTMILGSEMGDLEAIAAMVIEEKLVNEIDVRQGRARKVERLAFYLQTTAHGR